MIKQSGKFLSIVLAALCLCACSPVWFLTKKDDALNWPVTLEKGRFDSPKFKPLYPDKAYSIELSAKRTIPFETLGCYMGTAVTSEHCKSHGSLIAIRWEMWGNGELVASGMEEGDRSNNSWSDESTTRIFGRFTAKPNVVYQLKIEVLHDGTLLEPAKPEFHVSACHNPVNQYCSGLICTDTSIGGSFT